MCIVFLGFIKKSMVSGTSFHGVASSGYRTGNSKCVNVHILRNHFPEVTDGILRPEVATVGCGRRPQHF